MLGRITRYFFVGGASASIDLTFFFVFAKLLGFNYLAVATIGFVIATLFNYFLSIRVVFDSGARFTRSQELALVYLVSVIALGVNLLVLFVMVDYLRAELMLSKIVATVSVFFWNFSARNYFIFRKPVSSKDAT